MMGLEEHLIGMFRHDFEFVDGHQSHLGHLGGLQAAQPEAATAVAVAAAAGDGSGDITLTWTADGEAELKKIPFFVRGKVRRNTETYAREQGRSQIDSETLYDAKAHFSA